MPAAEENIVLHNAEDDRIQDGFICPKQIIQNHNLLLFRNKERKNAKQNNSSNNAVKNINVNRLKMGRETPAKIY